MIDLEKLSKYQVGMIISSIIFLVSMLGFIFNSNVRVSESYSEIPDIIIEEPIDIDPENTEPKRYTFNEILFMLVFTMPVLYIANKVLGDMLDVF